MTNYEILMIWDPSLDEKSIQDKISNFKQWIENLGGQMTQSEDKGIDRLAYEIKKTMQGRFIYVLFSLDPLKIDAFRHELRLDEQIWRYNIKKLLPVKV
ncbi:MAG: 30S ribosomal protein S6 [bacterium (Candidatus Stahlbacteria) CG23_combo_of_CG06-09_8_20_14_all_34_7]|nr:MAG: 30S ribosomal protein S6 [bacterium (Candidatus Stahlbacteria) CG23_combo_of_CG06-09_8_20_14_all_34_7]